MKKLLILFLVLATASCGSNNPGGAVNAPQEKVSSLEAAPVRTGAGQGDYREGEVLVKFRPGVSAATLSRVHQLFSAAVIRRFSSIPGLEHVRLPEGLPVKQALDAYIADPSVEYAEPNYLRRASATVPNDPFFDLEWGLRNLGQTSGSVAGADIRAVDAWDISTGGDVVVAVIDSGVDHLHPDLAANIWINTDEVPDNGLDDDANGKIDDVRGWNFVGANNRVMDDEGHGTHVSGIIGAAGNNGAGITGVNWTVKIMPLKILDATGEGSIADEIAAFQYAIANGAKVINASFSGSQFSNAELAAVTAAHRAGVIVAAAAGNGGEDQMGDDNDHIPQYPASYNLSNVISVAATDEANRLADFSNYGVRSVHVAAPGVHILSTVPAFVAASRYSYASGTSMAAPHVSGLAALLYGYYRDFSFEKVRAMLLRYVETLPSLQGLVLTGGKINAYKSLSALLPPSGLSVSLPAPMQPLLTWTDNATGEDGYQLERSTGGEPYSLIATIGPNAVSYTDSQVTDGRSYAYRLRAFTRLENPLDSGTLQADSTPAETLVMIPLNMPVDLRVTAESPSQVSLAWTDTSATEDGFRIERKGPEGTFTQIAATGPNVTTYTDAGLKPSTSYSYVVTAFNASAGDSQKTPEAVVTTPAPPVAATSGGNGGGGCSIGPKGEAAGASADAVMMMMPVLVILGLKGMRRRKK